MSVNRAHVLTLIAVSLIVSLTASGSDNRESSTTAAAPSASDTTLAGSSVPDAASEVTIHTELRDVRYCEVIPAVQDGDNVITYVYNTLGQNFCPPKKWSQLTEDEVNQEFGSQSAKLNGPRHWVLDAIQDSGSSATGETFTFGGIEMNLRATLTTPAGQETVGDQFYTPNEVARDTIWTYDAGKPIYTLTDPDGNVYVMQSYAQIADRTLTIEQLPDLASKLDLPQGWSYSSQTLTEQLNLNSNGLATVINDNLYNSYQLMP